MTSELTFPVLECFHIIGFAMAAGTIALVDFRMLNLGMTRQKAADLADDLAPWTMLGLGLAFLAGGGLFMSDPDLYYLNHAFQIKMVLLLLALILHYTVRSKAVAGPEGSGKWVAIISLLLWAGIVGGGIFIGFAGDAA